MNEKAVILVRDSRDLEAVLAQVKWLDNNDDAFLAKLKEPLFLDKNHKEIFDLRLKAFLNHIFTTLERPRIASQIISTRERIYKNSMRVFGAMLNIKRKLRL